ncbi:MAG: HEAT repeat domain-containing protein, partial [Bacteroidales bacterium]|nr:HEAT repeat domain-containing protein [Bacteroidales bacterium]
MKTYGILQQVLLLLLAIIFSVALMFSFTELPRLLDSALQENVGFPGLDHAGNEINAYKAELYISALHLRWIGYASLGLIAAFIILGFVTKRSGWALAGAFTIFLPVFGQFALSMFFLAGLGMLRVGWLPFWDISFQVLDLGNVIYIPYWILMWVFRQFDYWAQPELGWFFMGCGAFLFTWGVMVWIQSRFGKQGVATSWIYRISRHPQYLGWIIWAYGLVIYAPLINQMKKSWGMASSLPWLLMTMIIIGLCMLEELKMKEKYGEQYEQYRNRTPFLFPIPKWMRKIIKFPMWLLIRKKRPEKKREVALVITIYTIILMAISLIWVDLGQKSVFPLSESRRHAEIEILVEELNEPIGWKVRWYKFNELKKYGDLSVTPMIAFLTSDNPENQENAARLIGEMGDTSAIRPLYELLDHPWENVRTCAIRSLAMLGDEKIIPVLTGRLQFETDAFPRAVIYDVLGNMQAREAWGILVDGSMNNEPWARLSAVKAMAKIYPDSTAQYLTPLLSHEHSWIRSDAAAVANQIQDEETLPYLEKLLNDDNYDIRFFAR